MNAGQLKTDVRIVQSRQLRDSAQHPPRESDDRQRDTRPGRFAVEGPFIKLPRAGENLESNQTA